MASSETGRTEAVKARKCKICAEVTTKGSPWGWSGFWCWECETVPDLSARMKMGSDRRFAAEMAKLKAWEAQA
jgi:hypothetical protein